jgi:hypothetical protein
MRMPRREVLKLADAALGLTAFSPARLFAQQSAAGLKPMTDAP